MNESVILKASFAISVLGIIILILFSIENEKMNVKKLYLEEEMSEVKGKVSQIRKSGSATYLTLETLNMENVIVFSNITLNIGDYIRVEGKRDGNIIAEKITRLENG